MNAKLNNKYYYSLNNLSFLAPTQLKKYFMTIVMAMAVTVLFAFPVFVYSDDIPVENSSAISPLENTVAASVAPVVETPQESTPSTEPNSAPSFKEKKEEEGYIVNLRDLIEKSKKRIEQVNGKLDEQAKRSRNLQREEKAREYYQKAMRLFEEGELTAAQELWEKAVKITEHPEMKDYVRESVVKKRKQEDAMRSAENQRLKRMEVERGYSAREVEAAYQKAVSLFKDKKFLAAKQEFENVDEMFPDHKATRSYLMLVDQEINKEQQVLIDQKLKEQAHVKLEAKEEWRKDMVRKERLHEEEREVQAAMLYDEALRFYKAGYLENAKAKFSEVEWIVPNYKATLKYIARIEKELDAKERKMDVTRARDANKSPEELWQEELRNQRLNHEEVKGGRNLEEAQFVYDSALALYNKGMLEESRLKFLEVKSLSPGFKATDKYLARLNKKLPSAAVLPTSEITTASANLKNQSSPFTMGGAVSREKLEEFKKEAEWIYNDAVALYNTKNYSQSYEKFRQVENLSPGFKDTTKYIARLQKTLNIVEATPIAAAASANPVDKAKIKRLYKKAVQLHKQGQEDPAREVFEEIVQLDPGHAGARKYLGKTADVAAAASEVMSSATADNAVMSGPYQAEAEDLYQQAVALYEAGKHVEAREKFNAVKRLAPGYKATNNYFERLGKITDTNRNQPLTEKIVDGDKEQIAKVDDVSSKMDQKQSLKKEKTKIRRAWKEMKSKRDRRQTRTEKEYQRYQTKIKKALDEKRRTEKMKFDATVDYYYTDAVKLFESGDYTGSQMKFLTVEGMKPRYKSTRKFLSRIEEVLSNQGFDYGDDRSEATEQESVEESESDRMAEVKDTPEPELKKKPAVEPVVREEKPVTKVDAAPKQRSNELAGFDEKVEPIRERTHAVRRRDESALKKLREQSEESRKHKEALEQQYQEIIKLMNNGDVIIAKKKLEILDEKATKERLDTTYRILLKKKIDAQRRRIEGMRYQSERQRRDVELRREEELVRQDYNLQLKKEQTVAKLENNIRVEEERLARDKQREQLRLNKEQKKISKEERLANQEETGVDMSTADPQTAKKDLDKMYKVRQKEIEAERARIRRSLQENLESLYQKAVVSYRAGDDEAAINIFQEIERMQPDYKSTKEFITKLQKTDKSRSSHIAQPIPPQSAKTTPPAGKSPSFQAKSEAVNQALDIIEKNF